MNKDQIEKLALLMFDSGHLTLPEHETLLTEWFEQNHPEQFEVNWGDVPKNTHYARLQVEWLNKMYQQTGISVLSKQERPQPMPQVKDAITKATGE